MDSQGLLLGHSRTETLIGVLQLRDIKGDFSELLAICTSLQRRMSRAWLISITFGSHEFSALLQSRTRVSSLAVRDYLWKVCLQSLAFT